MTDRKLMGVSTPPGRVIRRSPPPEPVEFNDQRRGRRTPGEAIRALEAFRPRWQAVSATAAQSLAGPS